MNRKTRLEFVLVAWALIALTGCWSEPKLEVVAGIDACHQCNMLIDQVNQACGYIENGELIPFDSPGCLLRDYDDRKTRGLHPPERIFFTSYDNGEWNPAESTSFLLTTHIPTVMNAAVLCFSSPEAAEALREHPDERVTDWSGYRTVRGKPDLVLEVVFGDSGMSPEVAEAAKGELVLLKATGNQLGGELEIEIKGYPEVGPITVPANGEEVSLRFLATRPGSGFPVVETKTGTPLGRLRVSGAHTLDEEAM